MGSLWLCKPRHGRASPAALGRPKAKGPAFAGAKKTPAALEFNDSNWFSTLFLLPGMLQYSGKK